MLLTCESRPSIDTLLSSAEGVLSSLDKVDLDDKAGGADQMALCSKELIHDEIMINVVVDDDADSAFVVKFDMADVATALEKVLAEQLKMKDDVRPVASCYEDGKRIVVRLSLPEVSYLQSLIYAFLDSSRPLGSLILEELKTMKSRLYLQELGQSAVPHIDNDAAYRRVTMNVDQTLSAEMYEKTMLTLENLTPDQVINSFVYFERGYSCALDRHIHATFTKLNLNTNAPGGKTGAVQRQSEGKHRSSGRRWKDVPGSSRDAPNHYSREPKYRALHHSRRSTLHARCQVAIPSPAQNTQRRVRRGIVEGTISSAVRV